MDICTCTSTYLRMANVFIINGPPLHDGLGVRPMRAETNAYAHSAHGVLNRDLTMNWVE